MNIIIRQATPNDFPAILALVKSLALFEKAEDAVTNTVEQMYEEQDCFNCFIAETECGEVVGMAVYFFAYYTWVGKSLYLDDLYVKDDYRGQQIGTQLLAKIFEVAKAENCKRLRWQVLNWNKPAIDMYKKLGAKLDVQWDNCDFDVSDIKTFTL